MYISTYVCIHVHISTYTYIYICTYINIYIYIYVYADKCMHVCIYIYMICIYAYLCTHPMTFPSSPEVSTPFSTALQGHLLVSLAAFVDAATRSLTQALLVPAPPAPGTWHFNGVAGLYLQQNNMGAHGRTCFEW